MSDRKGTGSPLRNETVLVAGWTAGIRYHVALDLARLGAQVIVTGRDEDRGRDAVIDTDAAHDCPDDGVLPAMDVNERERAS